MNDDQRHAWLAAWLRDTLALRDTPSLIAVGASTEVYRVTHRASVWYLRVAAHESFSWAADVLLAHRLHASGLHVPEVVAFEPWHAGLQRSLVLHSALEGSAIGYARLEDFKPRILWDAGRELALLNQLPIAGFGSLAHHREVSHLAGVFLNHQDYLDHYLHDPLQVLHTTALLSEQELARVVTLLAHFRLQCLGSQAFLAHGDMSPLHVFFHRDVYTGIIDPDARATHPRYDLGHLHALYPEFFAAIRAGYESIEPLTSEDRYLIRFWGLLIATRKLGKKYAEGRLTPRHQHQLVTVIRDNLTVL